MRPCLLLTCALAAAAAAPALAQEATYPLKGDNTTIQFVGTKPNGKHEGGFKTVNGTATLRGNDLSTLKIELEIDVSSLYSDNKKLTAHLLSPDFFGVRQNPKAKFVTTKVQAGGDGVTVTGDLTLLGKTKSISFPAKVTADGESLRLSSRFRIDRTEFGMTYGRGKIDDQVSLTVSVNAKK
jgi:polyisoprenoid-binding protein YceI